MGLNQAFNFSERSGDDIVSHALCVLFETFEPTRDRRRNVAQASCSPPIIRLDDAVRHNLVRHGRRQSCRRPIRNSPVSLISMDNISTALARPRIGMASATARAASRLPFQPTTTCLPMGRAPQVRFLYGTAFSLARIALTSTLNLLDWLYIPF